ncbi:insulin-like growth factor-binding protein complex acid labile subunit isoform X2 [Drosophila eugracilis]|uniref:insulin-like growth factor-binding protein complex acid labile subunit isoform X2 n=1 Tax=Drosophila eugracilis TaxID=29029 RepID=UPI0007E6EA66|nr:insulin-like growth factor-binding protein complex acid labile subunit isoform X2 [Drosophila eugracilis]
MHYYIYLLIGVFGLKVGEALPVYDATGRFNLSASCPESFCQLNDQPVAYSASPALELRELLLTNCSRQSIPWLVLNLTPGLRTLIIRNCATYHINKEVLKVVGNLTSLQMQSTRLGVLRDEIFTTVPRLEILELGQNIIHTVHVDAFKGLAKLRLLGLQGNGIQEIQTRTLDPLVELVHLDLSSNQLTILPQNIFAKNNKMQTLLLNGNQMKTLLPEVLTSLPNLRLLDLGHAGDLDTLMLDLRNVQNLILEGSRLSSLVINGGFISLQAGNNELNNLHVGNKSAVIEMDLHGNLLNGNDIASFLRGMWNLQRLDLSKNIIETLPLHGSGSEDPDSQELFLLPSLKYLNLANNRLVSLPSDSPIFSSRLNFLDLSHNLILTLDVEILRGLPVLQGLFVEGNRLNTFDYQLFHQQHEDLKELGLHDNAWALGLYRKMFVYLTDRGVHLQAGPQTHAPINRSLVDIDWPPTSEAQKLDPPGVSGIHPYWTLRDILAFVTLLVVLIILLMNLYHILEEEGCLRRFRHWRRSTILGGAQLQ